MELSIALIAEEVAAAPVLLQAKLELRVVDNHMTLDFESRNEWLCANRAEMILLDELFRWTSLAVNCIDVTLN